MRAPAIPTLAIALASAIAALAGCGGATDTTTAAAGPAKSVPTPPPAAAKPKATAHRNERPSAPPGGGEAPPPAAPTDPNPLPNQGTKAVAPGVPTAKGGDNSVQSYGEEAESAERVQAAATAAAFLHAEAAGSWARACSDLSASLRSRLGAAPRQGPSGEAGCAKAISILLAKAPKSVLRRAAEIDVLSMRTSGDQGFLIYREAGGGAVASLPMTLEGGRWKVGSLSGIELPL